MSDANVKFLAIKLTLLLLVIAGMGKRVRSQIVIYSEKSFQIMVELIDLKNR